MKVKKIINLLSVLFLQSQFISAYDFSHPEAREISYLINKSLSVQKLEDILFTYPVLSRYQHLARHTVPVQELLELQYKIQDWRIKAAALSFSLMRQIKKMSSEEYEELLSIFLNLDFRLSPSELKEIFEKRPHEHSPNYSREKLLNSFQAFPESSSVPMTLLPIFPLKVSQLTFEHWSKIPGQKRYAIYDTKVSFRGQELRSGDFFLGDLAVDNAAFFAALCEGETYIPHLAVFVLLDNEDGYPIPVVLEMIGSGLRAVPLNVYFSANFSAYTEIYRLKEQPLKWHQKLNKAARKFLAKPLSYNLSGTSSHKENFQTCASFGNLILDETKIAPIEHPAVLSPLNTALKELKIKLLTVFPSSSFAQDKRFAYVGAVDNGHFLHSVARQIVVNYLKIFMNTHVLKLDLLPKSFNDKKYWVDIIQEGGCVAQILLYLSGYGSASFPSGSSEMLSIAPIFSKAFKASILEVEEHIKPIFNNINKETNFSIHDFQEDPQVKDIVEQATKNFRVWFE